MPNNLALDFDTYRIARFRHQLLFCLNCKRYTSTGIFLNSLILVIDLTLDSLCFRVLILKIEHHPSITQNQHLEEKEEKCNQIMKFL